MLDSVPQLPPPWNRDNIIPDRVVLGFNEENAESIERAAGAPSAAAAAPQPVPTPALAAVVQCECIFPGFLDDAAVA